MKRLVGVLLAGSSLLVAGCAGPVVLGVNLGTASTVGSVISTAATGKGLGEHALSAATDKDCAIIEGAFRPDRKFCEEKGAEATKSDFRGLAVLFDERQPQPASAIMLAEAPPEKGDILAEEARAVTAETRTVEAVALEPVSIATAETAAVAQPQPQPVKAERPAPARAIVAAAPPAPRAKPAAEGPYLVQVGTFSKPSAAVTLVKQLRDAGYQASHSDRKGMSVVRVKGFSDANAAQAAANRIGKTWRTDPTVMDSRA